MEKLIGQNRHIKSEAISQYLRRRKASFQTGQIDNSALESGSCMFFYCKHCGILIDRLPEDYLFTPSNKCSQCVGLEKIDLLEDAKAHASEISWPELKGVE